MAFSTVGTKVGTFGAFGGTTTPMNTTGATLIIAAVNYHRSFGGGTVTDSAGNVWTLFRSEVSTIAAVKLYYCSNPTPSATHTFTTNGGISNLFVLAVSGSLVPSPADQQNAGVNNTNAVATGSITPSTNDCLVFTIYGGFNPGAAPTISAGGSGFTIPTGWSIATGTSECGAAAYKIQTTAAAENVTWDSTGSVWSTAIIVSFKPSLPTPTSTGGFFSLM